MNDKETATRLQEILEHNGNELRDDIAQLIDELKPPLPAPGTSILWRYNPVHLASIPWKPARIAGENEVVVDRGDLRKALDFLAISEPGLYEIRDLRDRLYKALEEPDDE